MFFIEHEIWTTKKIYNYIIKKITKKFDIYKGLIYFIRI